MYRECPQQSETITEHPDHHKQKKIKSVKRRCQQNKTKKIQTLEKNATQTYRAPHGHQSPHACTRRDKERLEKRAEDALEAGKEEARQRTVAVGRYELTLDILADDLQDAKEKLAEVRARNAKHMA